MFDYLKIHKFSDIFGKYVVSWSGSLFLLTEAEYKTFIPVVSQVSILLFTQLILFCFDWARLKFLKEKQKRTIKQVENKIEILEEKIENPRENSPDGENLK